MFYKTRRSWVLAEMILGYIAATVGVSGSMYHGGVLNSILVDSGDALVWGFAFFFIGTFQFLIACYAEWIRDCSLPNQGYPLKLSRVRAIFHLLLAGCWVYAFTVLLEADDVVATLLMQAPFLVVIHVRGAWEHVKACRVRAHDAKYNRLRDLIRDRIRSGDGSSV